MSGVHGQGREMGGEGRTHWKGETTFPSFSINTRWSGQAKGKGQGQKTVKLGSARDLNSPSVLGACQRAHTKRTGHHQLDRSFRGSRLLYGLTPMSLVP